MKRRILAIALIIVFALGMTACKSSSDKPADDSKEEKTEEKGADDYAMRIPLTGIMCEAPTSVAYLLGYFDDEGLKYETYKTDGTTNYDTMLSGQNDVIFGLLPTMVQRMASGFKMDVVMGAHYGCINMVVSEIASDYIPVEFEEEVEVDNGIIPYDKLSKRLINLKNITKNSTKIVTKMYPNEILVKADGLVKVCYLYMPEEVKLGDSIELSPKVTTMLIVYGALGEYCLLQGRYEDANLYDKRYREMLKVACRVTKEIKLKHGWWNS